MQEADCRPDLRNAKALIAFPKYSEHSTAWNILFSWASRIIAGYNNLILIEFMGNVRLRLLSMLSWNLVKIHPATYRAIDGATSFEVQPSARAQLAQDPAHQVRHSATRRRTDENRLALSLAVGLGVARAPQACTTKEADTVPITAHSTTGRPATSPARKPPQ
jgi:hypothetical protein